MDGDFVFGDCAHPVPAGFVNYHLNAPLVEECELAPFEGWPVGVLPDLDPPVRTDSEVEMLLLFVLLHEQTDDRLDTWFAARRRQYQVLRHRVIHVDVVRLRR